MKKLIEILGTSILFTSSTVSLVSCSDEKIGRKYDKKNHSKKDESNDNEENEDNNGETIDEILEKLQNLKLIAHLKANGNNTMTNLISEISNRKEIKAIVQNYDFKVTTDMDKILVLAQSLYPFKITLENDQLNEENDKSISVDLEVIVKKETVNLEKEKYIAILNKTDVLIKEKIENFYFFADKVNTYKNIKEQIKTTLIKVASENNVDLNIKFIDHIFKDDNEVIYQSINPFEIEVDLICKDKNEYSISKTYDSIKISGFTKERIKSSDASNSKYAEQQELLKILFEDEKFTNRLSDLCEIKANGINDNEELVKKMENLINSPKNIIFEELFNTSKTKELQDFKYRFDLLEKNKLLNADEPVRIKISVFDKDFNSALCFFQNDFKLPVKGETKEEKFNRIATAIKYYIDNDNKFDFTQVIELQADGERTWNKLFEKLSNKENVEKFFKPNILSKKDMDVVDFNFSLDKSQNITNEDYLVNSGKGYYGINLELLPADKTIDKKNAKSTKANFKVGGLNQQQVDEIQFKRVANIMQNQLEEVDVYELIKFQGLEINKQTTWTQLLSKLTNMGKNLKNQLNFKGLNETEKDLVKFDFAINENEIIHKEDNVLDYELNKKIMFDLKLLPSNKNVDKKNAISAKVNFKVMDIDKAKVELESFGKFLQDKLVWAVKDQKGNPEFEKLVSEFLDYFYDKTGNLKDGLKDVNKIYGKDFSETFDFKSEAWIKYYKHRWNINENPSDFPSITEDTAEKIEKAFYKTEFMKKIHEKVSNLKKYMPLLI